VVGQVDELTAHVTIAAPGSGSPGGSVTFYDGSTAIGSAGLTGGVATLSYRFTGTGSHSITAAYTGDLTDKTSSSSAVAVNVGMDTTRTILVAVPVSPAAGQSFTLKATEQVVAPGSGTPTGSVTFYEGANVLGAANLSGGVATLSLSYPTTGGHIFYAIYSGDPNDKASTSALAAVTIGAATTKTVVSFSPTSVVVGQPVNLNATVSVVSPGAGTPTGSVMFLLGTVPLGTVPLSGNQATLPWTFTAVGTQTINAVYLGDANDKLSSGVANLAVRQDTTTTTVTSSGTPSVLGQSVTFTATVAPVSPGAGVPTGNVVFKDGATVLATVPLAGGVATYSTSTLTQGVHSISAAYQGDTNNRASNSAALLQRVQSATAIALSSSNPSATTGNVVTFIATVSDVAPGTITPSGLVTFYDGTTVIGTATLAGGVARLKLTTLGTGAHSITAVYAGDVNHQGSTSSAITQTIS
jgi:hypothetical protein